MRLGREKAKNQWQSEYNNRMFLLTIFVYSMSLGGGKSTALDDAVKAAVAVS